MRDSNQGGRAQRSNHVRPWFESRHGRSPHFVRFAGVPESHSLASPFASRASLRLIRVSLARGTAVTALRDGSVGMVGRDGSASMSDSDQGGRGRWGYSSARVLVGAREWDVGLLGFEDATCW